MSSVLLAKAAGEWMREEPGAAFAQRHFVLDDAATSLGMDGLVTTYRTICGRWSVMSWDSQLAGLPACPECDRLCPRAEKRMRVL
jgi:hypothetical protein